MLSKFLLFFLCFWGFTSLSQVKQTFDNKNVRLVEDITKDKTSLICTKGSDNQLLCRPPETGVVELTTKNLVVLRGPITSQSSSRFVREFLELEHRDEVQTIYIYISSPGGSVFAGDSIANIMQSSKKQVVVVIDFAASMAFHVAQFATKRMILPTGTMMQHHASGGIGPAEFPNLETQWSWLKRKIGMMNAKDAARCYKTGFQAFKKKIDRDWWLLSEEALAAGCVDAIADKVICSKDLLEGTRKETISLFGFEIEITWSGCPLETYPRSIAAKEAFTNSTYPKSLTEKETRFVEDYVMLLTDPLLYYNSKGGFDLSRFVGRKESNSGTK